MGVSVGCASDVAKAIKKEPRIAPLLRVIFIGAYYNVRGDDVAAEYIRNQASQGKLWLIDTRDGGSRGIYAYIGRQDRINYANEQIKPHGCIGQAFPTNTDQVGYKMGDTPSLLFVLPETIINGNRNDP